ncbi:hypothetical protein GMAR_ORF104 [Golden Marseillevirus]|uniref:hypothetical protein n=1 Tax=Golden Marseillevirus TaxID=1720526 RepID=UPI000877AE8A|nr:hypothetical protein GMAR_ORF104 [Golden Marseillevirus]ALX27478.1 hypothetical protein GMAR_ORF104 [Golden Marseillevirus]
MSDFEKFENMRDTEGMDERKADFLLDHVEFLESEIYRLKSCLERPIPHSIIRKRIEDELETVSATYYPLLEHLMSAEEKIGQVTRIIGPCLPKEEIRPFPVLRPTRRCQITGEHVGRILQKRDKEFYRIVSVSNGLVITRKLMLLTGDEYRFAVVGEEVNEHVFIAQFVEFVFPENCELPPHSSDFSRSKELEFRYLKRKVQKSGLESVVLGCISTDHIPNYLSSRTLLI